MLDNVRNLLYNRPELYELVYPEPDFSTPRFCREMFQRHLARDPHSILDVGCGTGRDLATLASWCRAECVGIDGQSRMIDYARESRPGVNWAIGDMRTMRLGRTFEAIICLGAVITYALSDDDLDSTLETLATHSDLGSVLVLDLPNAAAFLPGGQARPEQELTINTPEFAAKAVVRYEFNRPRQLLIRRRHWTLSDGSQEEDYCQYRMLFPSELAYRLRRAGFQVKGQFDNKDAQATDLTGTFLYVVATFDRSASAVERV